MGQKFGRRIEGEDKTKRIEGAGESKRMEEGESKKLGGKKTKRIQREGKKK